MESGGEHANDYCAQSDGDEYRVRCFGDIPHGAAENWNHHGACVANGKHPGGNPVYVVGLAE